MSYLCPLACFSPLNMLTVEILNARAKPKTHGVQNDRSLRRKPKANGVQQFSVILDTGRLRTGVQNLFLWHNTCCISKKTSPTGTPSCSSSAFSISTCLEVSRTVSAIGIRPMDSGHSQVSHAPSDTSMNSRTVKLCRSRSTQDQNCGTLTGSAKALQESSPDR
jgi:hypothetical protein